MSDKPTKRSGPVLIEEDDPALAGPAPSPADAPPPDEDAEVPAVAVILSDGYWRGRLLGRLFWASLVGLFLMGLTVAAYDFVDEMLGRNIWLGRAALAFAVVLAAVLFGLALQEMAALRRLRIIDGVQKLGAKALREADLEAAREAVDALDRLYRRRPELRWANERVEERREDMLDADALLDLAEREYLTPLDHAAEEAVARAARRVAAATALIPLAFADVLAALVVNLGMLREIAAIYGGRAGALGSWRLMRAVAAHLAATGLVAVGDDLLGPLLGGGVASKLSRRFGEGLVNGALTARVGVVAIELCRPLPYGVREKPTTTRLAKRALKGFTV